MNLDCRKFTEWYSNLLKMTYLSISKMPRDSAAVATVQCYFHSCGHKKITDLTIFSSSEFSPPPSSTTTSSNNLNISLALSRQNFAEKSSRNGKSHQQTNSVAVMVKKPCSLDRKKPLWKKLLFGSKKFRSIILLNVISIIYGMPLL